MADPLFQKFLQITADSNEISLEEVKTQAMDDAFQFKNVFHQWKSQGAAGQKESEESQDTSSPLKDRLNENQKLFWDEWRNKRGTGFEKYEVENRDQFRLCHPELREIARTKYRSVVGKAWPLDVEKEAQNTEGSSPADDPGTEPGPTEASQGQPIQRGDLDAEATFKKFLQVKTRYPREIQRVTEGKKVGTAAEMETIISEVELMVKSEQENMPDA
jgi:hypothetical protein